MNLRNAMRVGLVHFMAYPEIMWDPANILSSIDEIIADEYFDVIEMTQVYGDDMRKEVVRRVQASGMELAYGSQPQILGDKLNLHSRNDRDRQKALQKILDALEEAVEMEAVGFATMSGPDPGEEYRAEETKLFIDSLHKICQRAQELKPDMNVVVETFDRVPFAKNCMVGPTNEAVEIANELRREFPRFGLMLDLSHLPLLSETPEHAIPLAKDVLLHAHIGNCVMKEPDNLYYGDNHPPFGYEDSENSTDELVRYLKCLKEINYLNEQNPPILTIEVKPISILIRPACMGNVKRTLNRAIRQMES